LSSPGLKNEDQMKRTLKTLLALATAALAAHASADVIFYEHNDFDGRSFRADHRVDDFTRVGFNDRVSSVVVTGQAWEVCEHVDYGGQCVVLRPGHYRSLRDMRMNDRLSSARPVRQDVRYDHYAPRPMDGRVTLFEHDGFRGRAVNVERGIADFRRHGINNRASSLVVLGERWEACEYTNFSGRCVILRPGRYPSLAAMGLNNRLSSLRPVSPAVRYDEGRYAPAPLPVYDWRRRPEERLFQADVVSAYAVYAQPQQQCWVEKERVPQSQRNQPNVGGAIAGGVLGGIIGHQVGGHGDAATVGGAVIGAVIGSQVGNGGPATRKVERCTSAPPAAQPDHWEVVYRFRGVEHRAQTTFAPGPTLTVNGEGEPRL
jgi:uncharacterized protein YcfJ